MQIMSKSGCSLRKERASSYAFSSVFVHGPILVKQLADAQSSKLAVKISGLSFYRGVSSMAGLSGLYIGCNAKFIVQKKCRVFVCR